MIKYSVLAGLCLASAISVAAIALASGAPARSGPPNGAPMLPSFAEEFDGTVLDTTRWRTALKTCDNKSSVANRSLYGNRERQIYFDRDFLNVGVDPFSVRNGMLTITAKPLAPQAAAAVQEAVQRQPPEIRAGALSQVRYSSGVITSKCSFDQTFGYFEIRARWTGGKGIWPAFWLLPSGGGWPPEIDIVEAHGDKPQTAFQSLHSKLQKSITRKVAVPGAADQFHLYAVLWTRDTLDYYIDGVKTASIPTTADAARPMYMLVNLAIGGKWPGDPDGQTIMPAKMEIDHIRVWRFPEAPG